MNLLKGKISVVTGAGSGIGKGIARAFAREGANLILASRTRENLEATAEEIRPWGVETRVVVTDVTDEEQVKALFTAALGAFGRLDILVNNSGVFDGGPLEDISLKTWQRVMEVNLTGPFLCSREAMRIMKRQRGGRIINIGSISAQMPRVNAAPYAASKHGLVGLTKATALEGRDYGVSASCLHPGNVRTERRAASPTAADQEPMMTVDELAMTVVTMAALPAHVNMLEAIVLPVQQEYLGRG